mgnify:CR=1 FL=1
MPSTTKRETANPRACDCLFCGAKLKKGQMILGVFHGRILKHKFCDVHCQLDLSVRNAKHGEAGVCDD